MKAKKGGKDVIVRRVMTKAKLSRRKAEKAVNRVFDCMKHALWCGDEIEMPLGTLHTTTYKGRDRKGRQNLRNIATGEAMKVNAEYPGRRKVVKLKPNRKLILGPPALPAASQTRQAKRRTQAPVLPVRTKEWDLAEALLGRPVDQAIMAQLQRAVETYPNGKASNPGPNALRLRLNEFRARGWRFSSPEELAGQLCSHYWIK